MAHEALEDRRKALENTFFRKEEEKLLEKMREQRRAEHDLTALEESSGIHDRSLLQALSDAGVRAESLSALVVAPLVAVAWADGKLDERERLAVLSAAEELGIARHTPNFELLESWLRHKPPARLLDIWIEYATQLHGALPAQDRQVLARELIDRVRDVAERSGGLLGLGRISRHEKELIQRLEDALSAEG